MAAGVVLFADDLQVFLEVARRGRLTEAAKHLQINHTTVSRRITKLERAAQNRLFDRSVDGWTLTDVGDRLLAHAETVESALLLAQEECMATGPSLSGSVRILAPTGFGVYLLLPRLGRSREHHQDLTIEVVTANRHASLTAREFDLAVTIERPETRAVVVKKLATFTLELYATPHYLSSNAPIESVADLNRHVLIWYVEDALDQATYDLLHEFAPDAHPQIRTNNIAGQVQAAEAGLGIAFLPSFIADRNPRLQRILAARSRVVRSYWLSVPRNLSRLARVRSMMNLIDRLIADCDGFNAESR